MIAVDYRPGFEATIGDASPLVRYAAFVRDCAERRRAVPSAGAEDRLTSLIRHEAIRLRRDQASEWAAASRLLDLAGTA